MIRHAINPLYIKLESAWFTLCRKLKIPSYRYDVMYNTMVLVLPKPPIAKYILYMTICDACFKKLSDVKSLNHFCDQIQSISAQVIQLVINDSTRPPKAVELISEASEGLSRDDRGHGDNVTESAGAGLEDLDLIYFMMNHTSLEKEVLDGQYEVAESRSGDPTPQVCTEGPVFQSEQYKTLYQYYFNLVSQLPR